MMFADRTDAGRQLARRLAGLSAERLVVLGLPRGGVPVAHEIAVALGAPLDVIIVRKLGVPYQPELAMGAIGEGNVRVFNPEVLRASGVRAADLEAVEAAARSELTRRAARLRVRGERVPLDGCTALIVDDGIATGSTVRAACQVARAHGAARVLVAVPVAPPGTIAALRDVADDVFVLASPASFHGVGQFYADFAQTSDEEVVRLLHRARARDARSTPDRAVDALSPLDQDVVVEAGPVRLEGRLKLPAATDRVVVFAHGSGSSRHSTRNRIVADVLDQSGFGTLLFDLLTAGEEHDRRNVFDIELLATRLVAATHWLRTVPQTREARIGYFGASTGAAAALWASTDPSVDIDAVVSRGGRPDLAAPRLALVRAPTLLIVGGNDHTVVDLNRAAAAQLRCTKELKIVPGATHLFEEPGTLAAAAELARGWFLEHLTPGRKPSSV